MGTLFKAHLPCVICSYELIMFFSTVSESVDRKAEIQIPEYAKT